MRRTIEGYGLGGMPKFVKCVHVVSHDAKWEKIWHLAAAHIIQNNERWKCVYILNVYLIRAPTVSTCVSYTSL